jgi:hypothetical protein
MGLGVLLQLSCRNSTYVQTATLEQVQADANPSGPLITDITTNATAYARAEVPAYEKFEVTFQVDTVAQNLQLPFDANPPVGLEPGIGLTVDALFTSDNWQTVHRQPAFYYQDFEHEIQAGQDWIYPTENYAWKVRFAPNQSGNWQYKLIAEDASGTTESEPEGFTVVDSAQRGFIRVSKQDPRYFEYDDGTYFPALGYNLNYRRVDWVNPIQANKADFEIMGQNGIQLVRMWLSQWGLFVSAGPWQNYVGWSPLFFDETAPGSEVSLMLDGGWNKCVVYGWEAPQIPLKRNTSYRIRTRYKIADMGPAVDPGKPYGLVAKYGGWLWGGQNNCDLPGTGTLLTPHQNAVSQDWQTLESDFLSGDRDFMGLFHLALENVDQATVYVDHVWIQEDLGNGRFGPNIVAKPDMDMHYYFEQRNSYAFDKVLELAHQSGVYFKVTLLEKEEKLSKQLDYAGNFFPDEPACGDDEAENVPDRCPDHKWFYGDWRNITKGRWLQQAFWRYVQARWGYSTQIHSWELLNEGDPFDGRHYTFADEFGKYMHCRTFGISVPTGDGEACTYDHPNDHLVTTSFWHSYPLENFWGNEAYPNLDYADIHRYIYEGDDSWLRVDESWIQDITPEDFYDTAMFTNRLSLLVGAQQPYGAAMPIMRGETGFIFNNTDRFAQNADSGLWLHNYIWGGINPGGLIESYWASPPTHNHVISEESGTPHDHRPSFKSYYNFIKDIPMTNGHYQDVEAKVSNDDSLRAWGQKDLVAGQAHVWIQNKQHVWPNVVNEVSLSPASGTVTLSGFQADESYTAEWWDTYETDAAQQIINRETVLARSNGDIVLTITGLENDTAVKISRSARTE